LWQASVGGLCGQKRDDKHWAMDYIKGGTSAKGWATSVKL